jgi:Domain of unknown function (DUF5658)
MMPKIVTLLGLLLALSSVSAAAAGIDDSPAPDLPIATALVKPRPHIVPSLYVSLAVLQAYDGYSTLRGLRHGAREMNPIVAHAAGQPVVMWTLKAASTAATIYCAEQLWRSHRRGRAIALLVAANSMMGVIAARNASIVSTAR